MQCSFPAKNPIDVIKSLIQCDSTFDDTRYTQQVRSPCWSDIRSGEVYQNAQDEIQDLDPNGKLIGLVLSVDDTRMTSHSGSATGRPLYLTTANQSLESRRHASTNAWRITALLPCMKFPRPTTLEETWGTVAQCEFVNRTMELALQPLIGTSCA